MNISKFKVLAIAILAWTSAGCREERTEARGSAGEAAKEVTLLNVSYDPTREFYAAYNELFGAHYKKVAGTKVTVKQSHGGSGKQARAVLDGLSADVVTLALSHDIDVLAERGSLLPKNWQSLLPHNSTPYFSTIVFVVRKGNPKQIKDWDDLAKEGVQVITANPKTSGGARWNYLAAYGFALKKPGGTPESAAEFIRKVYKNAPVLDSGARGATTTFIERGIGDVLISWENEALLTTQKLKAGEFAIVTPSTSILAEPPVAVVESNAKKHGTADAAKAYLEFLYSPEAQELIAEHFFRPRDEKALAKVSDQHPKIPLFTIEDTFGGWHKAHEVHFSDGGLFDTIYGGK
jgi:sulfate/thiosulfate-binding protein